MNGAGAVPLSLAVDNWWEGLKFMVLLLSYGKCCLSSERTFIYLNQGADPKHSSISYESLPQEMLPLFEGYLNSRHNQLLVLNRST